MEEVAGANVESLRVDSSQGFGAAQTLRPVQKADLICSVSLAASELLMPRSPKTFLKRALKSGIVTLAHFFRAAGIRSQATVRPRLVTSGSSPE